MKNQKSYWCDKHQSEVERRSDLCNEHKYPHPEGQYEDDECVHGVCKECKELGEANAKLAAAAPDLLEACKYTIEQAGLSTNSPSYNKLQQAISKAEGR